MSSAGFRYCADSITASHIPVGFAFVAGYIDGRYAWTDADWALHPDSIQVRIAVDSATNDGHVLDVEPGDATPRQAVGWVQMRRAAGIDPTVYCGIGQWDAVRQEFEVREIPQPHYWIAHYDNDPTPLHGAIAKQYANATFTHGHYDASVVEGFWPGVEGNDVTPEEAKAIAVQAIADAGLDPNTVEIIKKSLDKHVHIPIPGSAQTSGPLVPPVDGAQYAGSSADSSQVFWLYPGETTPRA